MMSITSLFRRHEDIDTEAAPTYQNNGAWTEKQAEPPVDSQEWLRPRPAPPEPGFVSLTAAKPAEAARIPWTRSAPTVAGPYWYVEQHGSAINLCIVIDFGGRLCIRQRGTDSCTYVSVSQLNRYWSGPLPIPVGVDLEDLA